MKLRSMMTFETWDAQFPFPKPSEIEDCFTNLYSTQRDGSAAKSASGALQNTLW